MKIYRIRHAITGLYSKGGNWPRWSKAGKIWKNIGHIKVHLQNLSARYCSTDPNLDTKNWIVETYELVESFVKQENVSVYLDEIKLRKAEKEQEQEDQRRHREDLKRQALSRLSPAERQALGI